MAHAVGAPGGRDPAPNRSRSPNEVREPTFAAPEDLDLRKRHRGGSAGQERLVDRSRTSFKTTHAEDAEKVRADLRSRELAPGLAQETKFDARDDDPSLCRRCAA
jgi:hypothetical protein